MRLRLLLHILEWKWRVTMKALLVLIWMAVVVASSQRVIPGVADGAWRTQSCDSCRDVSWPWKWGMTSSAKSWYESSVAPRLASSPPISR